MDSTPSVLRVALAQLAVVDGDVERNLEQMAQAMRAASRARADVLLLPELCLTGFVTGEALTRLAEPPDGPMHRRMRDLAVQQRLAVAFSYPEQGMDGYLRIATQVVDRDGRVMHTYHKTHLFGEEKALYKPGDSMTPFSLLGWPTGLLTCYDIEFPEPMRRLAFAGCRLFLMNAANMEPYERIHKVFVAARAIENQSYVVYCNRVGANSRYRYRGGSAIVAPDGTLLVDIGFDQEDVQWVDIEWETLVQARRDYDYLVDLRVR